MRFRNLASLSLPVLAVTLSVGATSALAQTSLGIIAGSVTDQTGAAVPNAVVTVTSKDTGETHTVKASASGAFRLEALGTGNYNVIVTAPGFSKEQVDNVSVQPSVTTSIEPQLKVGQATDTVEVSSSTEVLQTESGEVSAVLTSAEISQLPINGLNAYSLATTLPGVTTVTEAGFTNGTAFSVNGLRPRANNYLIEGQDNNDAAITGQAFQPRNTESVDNITFLLNSFSAEFGNGGGSVSNLVFKSGTNHYHGSVYDRLFNSSLNATDHSLTLNNAVKSKTRENIYGFTLGGPVLKDKLFLFGAYQQDHFRSTTTLSQLILPTAAGYATLKQFTGNQKVANLLNAYAGLTAIAGKYPSLDRTIALGPDPVTGVDRGSVQYGGYQRSAPQNQNQSELDLKADYLFNQDKDKLQLRFIRSYNLVPFDVGNFPAQLPNFDTNQGGPAYNTGIVETHQFSSKLLNEFRLSYSRILFTFDLQPNTYANPLALSPTVGIANVQGYGIPTNVPQGRGHNTYQLQDALSYALGNHSLKVGFDVNQIRVRDKVPFVFYGSINYVNSSAGNQVVTAANGTTTTTAIPTYTALANYIDDYSGYVSATGQSLSQQFGSNTARPTLQSQNYYIQDHWKATPRLAVDYGLRYEYTGAPFNYAPYPSIDLSNITAFQVRTPDKPNYKNFAPRLGFAYSPEFAHDKLVVRGGFGIFYDHLFTNIADNLTATAPNDASPVLYGATTNVGGLTASPRGTPNWSGQFALLNKNPLPTNSETTLLDNLKNPLTYQYNFAVEGQLPGAMSLSVGYAGSRGEHLYSLEFLNPIINAGTARLYPTRGNISAFANSGDSDYNAIELDLQRKYRKGLFARVAYTYSKSLDDVSDPYTSGNESAYPQIEVATPGAPTNSRGLDWGPSAYDHKQRAVLSLVYNTPTYHATNGFGKIVAALVNTYELSTITAFQTGSAINVQTGLDINGDGVTNDRPVLTNKNAPINTFSVRAADFYSAPNNPTNAAYCDGSFINSPTNPVNNTNQGYCHPVTLAQDHFYIGTRNQQNPNTLSRNFDYTPGVLTNNDFTAQRSFHVYEGQRLDFRAEVFNALNHANTGIPTLSLYSSNLQPVEVGYGRGAFFNYAATGIGGRTLRFFVKYQF